MWYYNLCRRIASINRSIFGKFNIYNFLYSILFSFVFIILVTLSYDLFSKEKILIFISFLVVWIVVRPLIIILYYRYFRKISFVNGLKYLEKDITSLSINSIINLIKLLILYVSYSIFATVAIFSYIEMVVSCVLGEDFLRDMVVKYIFLSYYNKIHVFYVYSGIICYYFVVFVICYPLLSIIESNLVKIHEKWKFYKPNLMMLSIIFFALGLCSYFLIYSKFMQQADFLDGNIKMVTQEEFELVKNELISRASYILKGAVFIIFVIILIIDEYNVTRLYLRNKRK